MTEDILTPTENLNKLPPLPVGFDPGNGFAKICLFDKVAKVPSNFSYDEPQGELSSKTLARVKAKSFSVSSGDRSLWFGLDSLDNGNGKEIDQGKYHEAYLKPLFSACLVHWMKQHGENPTVLNGKRLNVAASMPPELYQDKSNRTKVERTYKGIFSHRVDWQVQSNVFDTFQLFTQFKRVTAETLTYMSVNQSKVGYTVVFDLGYGTLDIAIFKDGQHTPLLTKSLNKGLLHAFSTINALAINQTELDIIRSKAYDRLDNYFAEVKTIIQTVTRKLPTDSTKIVGIGGGVKLMSGTTKASFTRSFDTLTLKDEFTNVRANAKVASGV